jgi:hypothetical protein
VLRSRWVILAVLFAVRLTMGFQFQSVAAVAPLLGRDFGVGLADIGILIGLYFTPGVALALPGGAIGQRFGDKRTVLAALMLMLIGGLAMALSDSWTVQIAGRLVAGSGGVLLNVQMTKMVADWFAGREIATAMAIFVNSWPAGVAVALLTLPSVGTAYGVSAVYLAVAALIAFAFVLLAVSTFSELRDHGYDIRTARPQRRDCRDRGGFDLGPLQCRVCDDLQFRSLDAGRARLVDRGGGINHQYCIMAGGGLGSLGRLSGGSNQTSSIHSRRRLRRVRDPDGGVATQRRGGLDCRSAWIDLRPPRRTNPEPARARAAAGDACRRHGHILHPLLCHHDARAGRRRRLRQMDRRRRRRIRFRGDGASAVPSHSLGLQSGSGGDAEDGVIRT